MKAATKTRLNRFAILRHSTVGPALNRPRVEPVAAGRNRLRPSPGSSALRRTILLGLALLPLAGLIPDSDAFAARSFRPGSTPRAAASPASVFFDGRTYSGEDGATEACTAGAFTTGAFTAQYSAAEALAEHAGSQAAEDAQEVWQPGTATYLGIAPDAEIDFFRAESAVVTSVSKHEEPLWHAAAAVYVLKGEDIIAAGAEDLSDALRMVPGLDVAAIDFNQSAISSRGFTGIFADKMLVLLDGHPIYTPLFGGTVWSQWSTFLPDVDRIEVVRGPGGTLWGANAVNGVINIITKNAEDTQGVLLRAFAGSNSSVQSEARYGGGVNDFHYRFYARWGSSQGFGGNGGNDIADQRDEARLGYRMDWDLGKGLRMTSLGEYYNGRLGNDPRFDPGSASATTRDMGAKHETESFSGFWQVEKDFAGGSYAFLRAGADYIDRKVPFLGDFSNRRKTWDLEFQHRFRLHRTAVATWGADFRSSKLDINDGFVSFDTETDTLNVAGVFAQVELALGDRTLLTTGARVGHNTFSSTNFQPSVRLSYRLDGDQTLWAAVSRAINTQAFTDMYLDLSMPGSYQGETAVLRFTGDPDSGDGELLSYELGYRRHFGSAASFDATVFYNDYDQIAGWNGINPPVIGDDGQGGTVLLHPHDNLGEASAYGAESVLRFQATPWWSGEFNVSFLEFRLNGQDNPDVPQWKFNLRNRFELSPALEIVPTFHWVDSVETDPVFRSAAAEKRSLRISSYLRADLALNFEPGDGWPAISLVGRNLLERSHLESYEELVRTPSPVTRSWFIKLSKEF